MKKYAIIVAGGSGSRFGSTLPKQFALLGGEPVLMRTIRAFHAYDPHTDIIVALPTEHISLWNDLCRQHDFRIGVTIVEGGASRYESVKNALSAIESNDGIVAVHDGARPLVTERIIADGFDTAERTGTAIPVVAVTDTIRQLDRTGSHTVNRESLVAVQTPQVFNLRLLRDAYSTPPSPIFTDDASVVEYRGNDVTLFKGDVDNIKITHPNDLKIAELIIAERNG
ncbi:MAG: 2-C-methyl-D-erythritol 4-phosphate cytidylyltransferase [Candidatus Limisoma sp.]|nr:2-C-methyl-D-erythritol 4-phosphate cytidylyltransferase [Candidatus Limisoma sp.]MDY5999891.1 2-C-methyl-D-erythritol 4-phosphate cytidylyltransferase [Candidatus Limisoma sp.]